MANILESGIMEGWGCESGMLGGGFFQEWDQEGCLQEWDVGGDLRKWDQGEGSISNRF